MNPLLEKTASEGKGGSKGSSIVYPDVGWPRGEKKGEGERERRNSTR